MEELGSRYDHKEIESKIYERWDKSGYFNPDNLPTSRVKGQGSRVKSFCVIMPPPNANGLLHMGHALFVATQDIIIRYKRMRGFKTLWLPGADHAGFETQVVYTKKLEKEGRKFWEIPREELYKEILDFTLANKAHMERQLKALGASCDWSREKFTLDDDIRKIVYETFKMLHDDGLLYRGSRIISWCSKHQTSLSDLEIFQPETNDTLYYLQYGPFTIATARPETKFGDKYVVVHPDDKRYAKYKNGEQFEFEWINGPITATLIKDPVIDMTFGTGAMTITPWHDSADFELASRHNLPKEQIIDWHGKLLPIAGEFAGQHISKARPKVVEKLRQKNLLVKAESYVHAVPVCYKCNTPIEPQIRPQWFVAMTKPSKRLGASLRDLAVKAVKSGRVKFVTERFKNDFLRWMENIRDWNISRQIVWGIRIPAWFCLGCSAPKIDATIKSRWFIVRHGETDWNKEKRYQGRVDMPLNDTGIAQAKTAAEKLKTRDIDLIITSPLLRAQQTAEIIAKECGVEILVENDVRERDFGEWEGLKHEEIKKKYSPESFAKRLDPNFQVPGGESWQEIIMRVWNAFQKHHTTHRHENVVIVGHGGVVRTLQHKIKNIPIVDSKLLDNAGIWEMDLSELCERCGGHFYEQDPDVFDTWFSSGQWPFLALGYQSEKNLKLKTENLKLKSDFDRFYPTDVIETGHDILFFWVARMVMFGLYRTGKVPFETVYLHGLVRDKDRQKMSKSKGNVLDPLGVADEYGMDAVRMALVSGNAAGTDPVISEEKIRGYRNFATKIWNMAKFVLAYKDASHEKARPTKRDKEVLKELEAMKKEIAENLDAYKIHIAAELVYQYIWHTVADKIIEEYKPRLKGTDPADKAAAASTITALFCECLKLLHPFMPFVTEELYGRFRPDKILMVENWET